MGKRMKYHKSIEIKTKLINNLMKHGDKNKGEKIIFKSLKEIQKASNKQSKELIKLSLIASTPTFKLHTISKRKNKKKKKQKPTEVPAFIPKDISRTSLAIKFITASIRKKKVQKLHDKLKEEILLGAQYKGESVKFKSDLQKQVLSSKHFFSYFRWR